MRFEVTFTVGQLGLGKLLSMVGPRTAQRAQIKPLPGNFDDDDLDMEAADDGVAAAPGYGKPGQPAKPTDIVMRGDNNDLGTGENMRVAVETLERLEAEHGIGQVRRRQLHVAMEEHGVPTKSCTGTISNALTRDIFRCMGPAQ